MSMNIVPVEWQRWDSRTLVFVDHAIDETGAARHDRNGNVIVQAHVLILSAGAAPQVLKIKVTNQPKTEVESFVNQQVTLHGLVARGWAMSSEKYGLSFSLPALGAVAKEASR